MLCVRVELVSALCEGGVGVSTLCEFGVGECFE